MFCCRLGIFIVIVVNNVLMIFWKKFVNIILIGIRIGIEVLVFNNSK